MIKRIELIMQSQNLTASQFADRIGIQRSGLSHILSGRNNPSLDFVLKVLKAFPELEPVWLLQGKGPMYANMSGSLPKEEKPAVEDAPVAEGHPEVLDSNVPELPFDEPFASGLAGSAVGQSPVFSSIAVDDSSVDSVSGSSSASQPFGLPLSDCGPEEVKAGLPQALDAAKRECEARNRPESAMEGLSAVGKKPCSDARVQRIVVFYEDGTFEAYAPR